MELDPRGSLVEVEEDLRKAKKDFDDLKDKDKPFFDSERLVNPYADTRILYGDPEREVKTALVGIDMEVGEILLAERLKQKGVPIDLVIAHHPEGRAMSALSDVMGMQSAILVKYGLPVHVAEDLMDERIKEVERRLLPANHTRAVDAARLLDMPFMCVHTPTDNAVATYLQKFLDDKKPAYVSDVLDSLREIPEYKGARRETVGPRVVTGSDKRRAGKIFVDMTGGTGGSKKDIRRAFLRRHRNHRRHAHKRRPQDRSQKHHVNVVIAGHISSDNLGINLLFDDIMDGVEVLACSGFRRISRKGR